MIGLILAGGKSTRFTNGDKVLFFDQQYNKTWLELAVEKMEQVASTVYISANPENYKKIEVLLPNYATKIVLDTPEFAGQGPLSGLYALSTKRPNESLLVISVDYPELSLTALQALAERSNSYAVDTEGNAHFTIGHFYFSTKELHDYLLAGNLRVGSFLKQISANPFLLPSDQLINHNFD